MLTYLCAGGLALVWFSRRPKRYVVVYKDTVWNGKAVQYCGGGKWCALYGARQAGMRNSGVELAGWALQPGGAPVFKPKQKVRAFNADTVLFAVWRPASQPGFA